MGTEAGLRSSYILKIQKMREKMGTPCLDSLLTFKMRVD
jgi:hypothetical protein